AENPGHGLSRPGAKLLKRWSARWPGEASPHGLGPALSSPDLFANLLPVPSFFLLAFYFLLRAPLPLYQEKVRAESRPQAPAPVYRPRVQRHPVRKAALPAPQQEAAELFPCQSQ